MSLVNDLLIEVDRRSAEQRGDIARPLDGLAPSDALRGGSRADWPARPILAGGAVLSLVVAGVVAFFALATEREALPSVSAPSHDAATLDMPFALDPTDAARTRDANPRPASVVRRPAVIRSMTVQRSSGGTRLELRADGPVAYDLLPQPGGERLEIGLAAALVADPVDARNLEATPIRSIETHRDAEGTRLAFVFDAPVRAQASGQQTDDGFVLSVELSTAASAERAAFESGLTRGDPPQAVGTPRAIAEPQTFVRPAALAERAAAGVDATPGLRIERSRGDHDRRALEQAERRAQEFMRSARFARSEGDLQSAVTHYGEALAALPGHRPAVQELAAVQLALGRPDEAIGMVRDLRRDAPRDAALAMLHARLYEQLGERDTAIELLERSGHTPTQAPELHAMLAAYLQRAARHEEAAERYETLLRRYPGRSSWWLGLGISLEALDRGSDALDVYRIAMQLGELPPKSRRWISARVEALGAEG